MYVTIAAIAIFPLLRVFLPQRLLLPPSLPPPLHLTTAKAAALSTGTLVASFTPPQLKTNLAKMRLHVDKDISMIYVVSNAISIDGVAAIRPVRDVL